MNVNGESVLSLPGATAHLHASASSDVGLVRRVNEDSFIAQSPVFLVADGMGGHARGDAASQAVVATFTQHIAADAPSTPERILDAIHSSNDAVRALSAFGDSGTAVSGTTLAGVALVDAGNGDGYHWMAFNIGDSRIYRWDGRVLAQLSVDHSAVQEMVDAGLLSAEDAEQHPERNVITRAIGADDTVDADVWLMPAIGRQSFLICSDGLSKEVEAREISAILASQGEESGSVAERLVDAALANGGRDNITVIVLESEIGTVGEETDSTRDRQVHADVEDTQPRA